MKQNPVFTDLFVRKLASPPAGSKRAEYYDGKLPGFGVRVSTAGTKTFFVVYRHQGAFRRMSLGRYPVVTLQEARQKAQDALRCVANDRDPQEPKRAAKPTRDDLFARMVAAFVEDHCKSYNRPSTAKETERLREKVFVPVWAKRPVGTITRADVAAVIDGIRAAGKPSAARHAFAGIRKFFNWCVERELLDQSPCSGMKAPGRQTARERVLADDELAAVLAATHEIGWPFGPIVRLLALTAQRRNEVLGMQWDEIDRQKKLWTIPGTRTKNKRTHTVPLTQAALAEIDALPRMAGSPYLFPARGKPERAYSGHSKGKRALNAACGVEDWTLHDLRRTAATGMAQAGTPPHVVEKILNHVSGTFGGVAGVYNRFGYLDEMRSALEAWERHMLALKHVKLAETA